MSELVVDASVAVELLTVEIHSLAVPRRFVTDEWIAPDLILGEVWNAVWKKHCEGLLARD